MKDLTMELCATVGMYIKDEGLTYWANSHCQDIGRVKVLTTALCAIIRMYISTTKNLTMEVCGTVSMYIENE